MQAGRLGERFWVEEISRLGCGGLYLSFVNKVSLLVSKVLLSDPGVSPTSSIVEVTEDFPGPYLVFPAPELQGQEAKGPCCATSAADAKTKLLPDRPVSAFHCWLQCDSPPCGLEKKIQQL